MGWIRSWSYSNKPEKVYIADYEPGACKQSTTWAFLYRYRPEGENEGRKDINNYSTGVWDRMHWGHICIQNKDILKLTVLIQIYFEALEGWHEGRNISSQSFRTNVQGSRICLSGRNVISEVVVCNLIFNKSRKYKQLFHRKLNMFLIKIECHPTSLIMNILIYLILLIKVNNINIQRTPGWSTPSTWLDLY